MTDANEPETEVETAAAEPEAVAEATVETAPDPHAFDDAHATVSARFDAALGDAILERASVFGIPLFRVDRNAWRRAAEVAKTVCECDYLSFVAGIDWMPAPRESDDGSGDTSSPAQPQETTYGTGGSDGRFQVFARVQSTSHPWGLILKADVDEVGLLAQSWVPVYAGADWHERECWEMYGIVFEGHPALRHLYLPSDFEGHPLRKDFPLLSRTVKPWPGLVDVEPMPGDDADAEGAALGAGEATS